MTGREENRGDDRPEDTMSAPTERELAAQLRVLRPAPAAWIAAAAAIPQGGLPAPEPSARGGGARPDDRDDPARQRLVSSSPEEQARRRDSELVTRCLDGDQDAWTALVQCYSAYVFTILTNGFGLDPASAQDVFQEVFTRAFRRLDTLKDPAP